MHAMPRSSTNNKTGFGCEMPKNLKSDIRQQGNKMKLHHHPTQYIIRPGAGCAKAG